MLIMIQLLVLISIFVASKCCPDTCRCFPAIHRTVCRARHITQIPKGIPPHTVLLSINYNNLSHIQSSDFDGLPKLKGLVISNTKISSLSLNVLERLKGLVLLNLKENMLTNIPKFPPNMLLESLHLQSNLLKSIDDQVFSELKSFRNLYLDHNNIQYIGNGSFENLKNLSKLSLTNNSIRSLAKRPFCCLNNLRTLTLNNNELTFLPDEVFDGLSNLKSLLINSNELTEIANMSFAPLVKVNRIELLRNKLRFLHQDTFLQQANLRFLYIYGNLLPCGCNFLSHLRRKNTNVFADCFDNRQLNTLGDGHNKSILSEQWGSWFSTHCAKGCSSAFTTSIRVRLCLDCSKKKYPSFCSFHINMENQTCVFIEGRNTNPPKAITTCDPLPWMNCSHTCKTSPGNSVSIIFVTGIALAVCGVVLLLGSLAQIFCFRRGLPSDALSGMPPNGAHDPGNSSGGSKSNAHSPDTETRTFRSSTNCTAFTNST